MHYELTPEEARLLNDAHNCLGSLYRNLVRAAKDQTPRDAYYFGELGSRVVSVQVKLDAVLSDHALRVEGKPVREWVVEQSFPKLVAKEDAS